ncbi:MAG: hypothetical protein MR038_06265 [Oscillospiraceae bacterium]|nr:hypothetical protein [Oscillospiraceae bacterium]
MSKYKNKRLHVSAFDFVFAVIFLGLLIASAFFWAERQETKGKFNIEQTKVDFIIEAPSQDQVAEIDARGDVDKVVPYVYRSADIKGNKKTVNSSLYIIENTDDLGYTVFSDRLKLQTTASTANNPLYVSYDLAKSAGLSLNDTTSITLSGTSIEFTISGIYKSDYRNVGGTAIAIMQNDVKALCGLEYKYNGAYVCSNDVSSTQSYIEKYVGMGDIRSADEFDSDDAYQQYLENRKNKNSTESTFYVSSFIKELERRYNSKLNRDLIISIAFIVGAALLLLIDLCGKPNRYTKNDVEKDIRNNFTLEQEKQMYGRYSFSGFFLYIIAVCAFIAISYFVFGNELISINNIAALGSTVLFSIIAKISTSGKLDKQFSIVSEKIKKESEGR